MHYTLTIYQCPWICMLKQSDQTIDLPLGQYLSVNWLKNLARTKVSQQPKPFYITNKWQIQFLTMNISTFPSLLPNQF